MTPKFKVSGRIARPVEEVFEAVADPTRLSRYFTTGGAKGRLETGATVTIGELPTVESVTAHTGSSTSVKYADRELPSVGLDAYTPGWLDVIGGDVTSGRNFTAAENTSAAAVALINDKLADPSGKLLDGLTEDGLHLSNKGYQVWADAMRPTLVEWLGEPDGRGDPAR